MRASFHTFGCKLNQYETEALASEFRNQGFSLVAPDQQAEVYLINTCTVTTKSEQKARRLIRKLSRTYPRSLLIVTGCYAQLNAEELARLGDNVVVVSQEDKAVLLRLPRLLEGRDAAEYPAVAQSLKAVASTKDPFRFEVERFSYHSRAFLKVQDGCDYRCTYCRVPLARGPSVSLDPEQALQRAKQMEQKGYREVVLTGVNLTAYRFGETGLPELLTTILAGTRALRLRLSSLEPEMITLELADALRDSRICPHFHIPVQSGSDEVLLRMRRRYRSRQIAVAVERLRQVKEDPFLAADFIVGFPAETEEDFLASYRLAQSLGLSKLHVFPFSPRPGTATEHPSNPVPERIRDQRVHELLSLSAGLHASYIRRWAGKEVAVVLERKRAGTGGGAWRGISENYLKVLVEGIPEESARAGQLVRALVEEAAVEEGDTLCRGRYLGSVRAPG
jgi:threonylcarbamoyladenosine tRNA methylthiotransferase MtaB